MLHSAPPRGPRGASSTTRGRGRGGIQKRRADGPARVDKDGDLDMDAAGGAKRRAGKGRLESSRPSSGTGRGNGASRGGLNVRKARTAILRGIGSQQVNVLETRITNGSALQVEGLSESKAAANADGGVEALCGFLERKASGMDAKSNRTVKIKKSLKNGDKVIITASPDDIVELQKVDGFSFAGTVLRITPCEPGSSSKGMEKKQEESPEAAAIKAKFKEVLFRRYNQETKLLDLSALDKDPGLIEMGVFDGNTTTSKVFPALMTVCDGLFTTRTQKREAIVSVTLANNQLPTVAVVGVLATTFPDIKNLDLSNNNLTNMESLDSWRFKFKHLEALVLNGNPIVAQLDGLKDEFLKRYQNLAYLNGVQVRTPEELAALKAAAEASRSPIPLTAPVFMDASGVGENFVRQFLALYDADKSSILSTYYDSQTTFSLSINMRSSRKHQDSKPIPPWTEYTKQSRNMTKLSHTHARMNRLHKGADAIKDVWSSLPASRHPDLVTQGDKYVIECQPTSGLPDASGQIPGGVDGLIVIIHGEFEEPNTMEKGTRSFSRTFILGPGMPGIQPIRVITDTLVLRAYSPLAQPQPQAQMVTPPQQPAQMIMTDQQKQEAIAMQLMEKTGMTLQYAGLCLEQTGWNLEAAFAAFLASKDNLPADAFLANVPR